MAGVSDLGLLKAAAGRGCVKKGFKKGMMGPPTEEVRLQRSIFWVEGTLPVIYLVQPATELTDRMDVCVCTGTG